MQTTPIKPRLMPALVRKVITERYVSEGKNSTVADIAKATGYSATAVRRVIRYIEGDRYDYSITDISPRDNIGIYMPTSRYLASIIREFQTKP